MNSIVKFFHELINPHCQHCMQLENAKREQDAINQEIELVKQNESLRCRGCESLERQIAVLLEQNSKLTDKIVNPNPIIASTNSEITPRPLHRGPTPFRMIKETLENESRARAQALKQAAQPDSPTVETTSNNTAELESLEDKVLNATISRTAETGTKQA